MIREWKWNKRKKIKLKKDRVKGREERKIMRRHKVAIKTKIIL